MLVATGFVAGSALVIEKVVEFLRSAFDSKGRVQTYIWNLAALVLGVGYALGWQLNYTALVTAQIPALEKNAALAGTAGQVLTGLVIGAAAGFWHAVFELFENVAKKAKTTAPSR